MGLESGNYLWCFFLCLLQFRIINTNLFCRLADEHRVSAPLEASATIFYQYPYRGTVQILIYRESRPRRSRNKPLSYVRSWHQHRQTLILNLLWTCTFFQVLSLDLNSAQLHYSLQGCFKIVCMDNGTLRDQTTHTLTTID
jgi:hypothetical protein